MPELNRTEHPETLGNTNLVDLHSYPDTIADSNIGSDPGSTYRTPRWAKVFGIILIVILTMLALIQHLVFAGMGGHMR